jgi:hypothetical protein
MLNDVAEVAMNGRIPQKTWLVVALALLLQTGCATVTERGNSILPTQFTTRTGPYIISTNYPLATDDDVVKQLVSLRTEVEDKLGLRVDDSEHKIEVYILSDRKTYEHFLKFYYPELPQRRAFFIANGDRRVVYTFKGDRLEEDVRHEATHALLNLAIGEIPLWLDEGLAEYFEAMSPTGLNREHLAKLPEDQADGWVPNLKRLESLKSVREMTPRDYREAWAWTHFLLQDHSGGYAALLSYLGELRSKDEPKALSGRLALSPEKESSILVAHIAKLEKPKQDKDKIATTAPTLRLQNVPLEIEPLESHTAAKKRSVLQRFFGRLLPF